MKQLALTLATVLLLAGHLTLAQSQEAPQMPAPVKEHEWLKKFVGEWESEAEIYMAPGQAPMKSQGQETARMLGGFWLIATGKSEAMGHPFEHVLTLGFDTPTNKYVGTWVDSMSGYLWKYEGTLDATGKILTLESEGPCPMRPGLTKFREVTEFKSDDHRVFTSSIQGEEGKWQTIMTVNSRRKK